jgi:uncharacterized NAD-dependent epimerase/dehydratase family protein
MPDHLVLCHEAGRESVHGFETFPLPDPGHIAELYVELAGAVAPTALLGGALNTSHLDDGAADDAIAEYERAIGAPAVDPVRHGAGTLVDRL